MAQCKYCNKKGIFLLVSKDGLCKKCEPGVVMAVNRHVEIITESGKIVKKTKNFKTKLGRLDTIKDNLLHLQEYEEKGINVIKQSTDNLLNDIEADRVNAINEEALLQITKHMDKSKLAKTVTTKVNNANKALLVIKQFGDEYGYENKEKASEILYYINDVQLEEYIEKGDKEQFKGNRKKARDFYMEALFFISKNEVSNDKVKSNIESKMKLLKE